MRTRVGVATAGAVLLLVAGTGAAQAAPTYGIPARTGGVDAASLLTGRVTLARADAAVGLAQQTLRVYAYEDFDTHGDTVTSRSRSWIVRRPGPSPTYGSFAPFTVAGHAGPAAVTATVVQSQAVEPRSATYLPMAIASRRTGDTSTSTVRASTVWRVTAATVGGVAVDVGPACVTSQALAVTLVGDPGFTDAGGGLLRGTFTVPSFTGCDGATRGASAQLTTAFAGRGNSVVLARGEVGTWDTTSGTDCRACGLPPAIP